MSNNGAHGASAQASADIYTFDAEDADIDAEPHQSSSVQHPHTFTSSNSAVRLRGSILMNRLTQQDGSTAPDQSLQENNNSRPKPAGYSRIKPNKRGREYTPLKTISPLCLNIAPQVGQDSGVPRARTNYLMVPTTPVDRSTARASRNTPATRPKNKRGRRNNTMPSEANASRPLTTALSPTSAPSSASSSSAQPAPPAIVDTSSATDNRTVEAILREGGWNDAEVERLLEIDEPIALSQAVFARHNAQASTSVAVSPHVSSADDTDSAIHDMQPNTARTTDAVVITGIPVQPLTDELTSPSLSATATPTLDIDDRYVDSESETYLSQRRSRRNTSANRVSTSSMRVTRSSTRRSAEDSPLPGITTTHRTSTRATSHESSDSDDTDEDLNQDTSRTVTSARGRRRGRASRATNRVREQPQSTVESTDFTPPSAASTSPMLSSSILDDEFDEMYAESQRAAAEDAFDDSIVSSTVVSPHYEEEEEVDHFNVNAISLHPSQERTLAAPVTHQPPRAGTVQGSFMMLRPGGGPILPGMRLRVTALNRAANSAPTGSQGSQMSERTSTTSSSTADHGNGDSAAAPSVTARSGSLQVLQRTLATQRSSFFTVPTRSAAAQLDTVESTSQQSGPRAPSKEAALHQLLVQYRARNNELIQSHTKFTTQLREARRRCRILEMSNEQRQQLLMERAEKMQTVEKDVCATVAKFIGGVLQTWMDENAANDSAPASESQAVTVAGKEHTSALFPNAFVVNGQVIDRDSALGKTLSGVASALDDVHNLLHLRMQQQHQAVHHSSQTTNGEVDGTGDVFMRMHGLNNQVQHLEAQLAEMRERAERAEHALQVRPSEMEDEVEKVRRRLHEVVHDSHEYAERAQKAEKENDNLHCELEERDRKIHTLSTDLSAMQSKHDTLMREHADLQNTCSNIQEKLEAVNRSWNESKATIVELEERVKDISVERKTISEEKKKLASEAAILRIKHEELLQENMLLKEEHTTLSAKHAALENEHAVIVAECVELRNRVSNTVVPAECAIGDDADKTAEMDAEMINEIYALKTSSWYSARSGDVAADAEHDRYAAEDDLASLLTDRSADNDVDIGGDNDTHVDVTTLRARLTHLRDQNAQLQYLNESLTGDNSELLKMNRDIRGKYMDLETRVADLEEELTSVNNSHHTLAASHEEIVQSRDQTSQLYTQLREEHDDAVAELTELKDMYSQLMVTHANAMDSHAKAVQHLTQAEERLAKLDKKHDALDVSSERVESLQKELRDTHDRYIASSIRLEQLEQQHASSMREVMELKSQLHDVTLQNDAHVAKMHHAEGELEKSAQELREARASLQEYKDMYARSEETTRTLQAALEALQQEYSTLRGDISDRLETQISDLKARCEEVCVEKRDADARISSLEAQYRREQEALTRTQEKVTEYKAQLKENNTKLARMKKDTTTLTRDKRVLEKQLAEAQEELMRWKECSFSLSNSGGNDVSVQLEAQIAALQATIQPLQSQIHGYEEKITLLEGEAQERETLREDIAVKLQQKEVQVQQLQDLAKEREGVVSALQRAVQESTATITQVQAELSSKEHRLQAMQHSLTTQEQVLSVSQQLLKEREARITSLEQDLQGKATILSSVESKLQDANRAVTDVNERIRIHELTLEEKTRLIEALQREISTYTRELEQSDEDKRSSASKLAELQQQLDAKKSELQHLVTDMSAATARHAELQQNYVSLLEIRSKEATMLAKAAEDRATRDDALEKLKQVEVLLAHTREEQASMSVDLSSVCTERDMLETKLTRLQRECESLSDQLAQRDAELCARENDVKRVEALHTTLTEEHGTLATEAAATKMQLQAAVTRHCRSVFETATLLKHCATILNPENPTSDGEPSSVLPTTTSPVTREASLHTSLKALATMDLLALQQATQCLPPHPPTRTSSPFAVATTTSAGRGDSAALLSVTMADNSIVRDDCPSLSQTTNTSPENTLRRALEVAMDVHSHYNQHVPAVLASITQLSESYHAAVRLCRMQFATLVSCYQGIYRPISDPHADHGRGLFPETHSAFLAQDARSTATVPSTIILNSPSTSPSVLSLSSSSSSSATTSTSASAVVMSLTRPTVAPTGIVTPTPAHLPVHCLDEVIFDRELLATTRDILSAHVNAAPTDDCANLPEVAYVMGLPLETLNTLVPIINQSIRSRLLFFAAVARELDNTTAVTTQQHKELTATRVELSNTQKQLQEARNQCTGLQARLASLEQDYSRVRQAHNEIRIDFDDLCLKYHELKENHRHTNEEHASLSATYTQLSTNYDVAVEKAQKMHQKYEKLRVKFESNRDKLEDVRKQLIFTADEYEEMCDQFRATSSKLKKAESELQVMARDYNAVKKTNQEFEGTIKFLRDKIIEYRETIRIFALHHSDISRANTPARPLHGRTTRPTNSPATVPTPLLYPIYSRDDPLPERLSPQNTLTHVSANSRSSQSTVSDVVDNTDNAPSQSSPVRCCLPSPPPPINSPPERSESHTQPQPHSAAVSREAMPTFTALPTPVSVLQLSGVRVRSRSRNNASLREAESSLERQSNGNNVHMATPSSEPSRINSASHCHNERSTVAIPSPAFSDVLLPVEHDNNVFGDIPADTSTHEPADTHSSSTSGRARRHRFVRKLNFEGVEEEEHDVSLRGTPAVHLAQSLSQPVPASGISAMLYQDLMDETHDQ